MDYVYLLVSLKDKKRIYIGRTKDLKQRLGEHNQGKSAYTRTYLPWKLEAYIAFSKSHLAVKFEKYLKQGSGFAFLKKRFLPNSL